MPKKILTETNNLLERGASYYDLLRVKPSATEEEIIKAYHKLSKQVHPDRNYDDTELATKVFKSVVKAYETLTDNNARPAYSAKINGLGNTFIFLKKMNNFKKLYIKKRGFLKNLFKKRKSHEIVAEETEKAINFFLKDPTPANLEKIKTIVKQGKQALEASKQNSRFKLGASSLENLLVDIEQKIIELSPIAKQQDQKEEIKSIRYDNS